MIERIINSRSFYRFLESLPGILSWMLIIIPIILAAYYPVAVAYFVLIYGVYWVYKSIKFMVMGFIGHEILLSVQKTDWLQKLDEDYKGGYEDIYYCTLIPFANESENVIRPTIQSVVDNNYPKSRKILCLSSEKAIPGGKLIAEKLYDEFKDKFYKVILTEHELKDGEIKGKASNENHAGRFLYKEFLKMNLNPEKILISSNDADMLNHKQYIPHLVYKFLSEGENRHYRIYQPVPSDYTYLWNANFFSRLIVTLSVQWRLSLHMRDNYRTSVYSFYSMSMKTLNDIGYWDPDIIPEDERTQFKAMYTFGDKFKVVPLFIFVSGRPVLAPTARQAFHEQYVQIRRHAWGASEFADSFSKALKYKKVSWKVKIMPIFNQLRTSIEWASGSFLPLVGGILPGLLNEGFRETVLGYALPSLLAILMQLASIMLVVIIYIEHRTAPKRPEGRGFFYYLSTYLQWFLLPYVGFVLSAIPAIDAQTRLIFNKRIVYIASRKE